MRRAALFTLLLAISCGGGTCGGCASDDYTYPAFDPERPDAVIQDRVARARLTQGFLDFIRPQLPQLIISQLGDLGGGFVIENGTIRVPIPDQELFDIGVAEAELREGFAIIFLDDLADRVALNLTPPSGAELVLQDLRVGLDLRLKENFLGIDSSCPVFGDLGSDPEHAAEITVRTEIDTNVGARPDYPLDIDLQFEGANVGRFSVDIPGRSVYCEESECQDCGIEILDVCLDPGGRCAECDIFCGLLTDAIAALIDVLDGVIRPLINDIVEPLLADVLDQALAQLDGQAVKLESQVDVASLTGIDLLRNAQPIGVFVAPEPGPLPVNDRGAGPGLELNFEAGLESEAADCVGPLEPFSATPGPVPELSGEVDGRPYHFGFTTSAALLNRVLYTAHRAGTLCLKLTSDDIRTLTGGAFTLNASLLSLVASDLSKLADPAAPVLIELKPRNPATVALGTGAQTGVDAQNNPVYDWLLQLDMADVGIAFHVLIQDRFVRIFEVTSDVSAGLNVSVLPDNTLEVALGELDISDFQEEFNELLPNADFAQILPTIVDLALGAVLGQALIFDIDISNTVSDALGGVPVFLRVDDIFRDGENQDYLTMSINFSTSIPQAFLRSAETQAMLHPSEPGVLQRDAATEWQARPTGSVQLLVGDSLPESVRTQLEYQVRVDGGLWSVWRKGREDGSLWAPDARLKMPGWHQVEVRARRIDDYKSLDGTPATVRVLVDPLAPRLTAQKGRDGVDVRVRDEESADAAGLQLEMRMADSQAWQAVSLIAFDDGTAEANIPYHALASGDRLSLRARDGSGNPSRVLSLDIDLPRAEDDVAPTPSAWQSPSCQNVAAHRQTLSLSWVLAAIGVVALRQRRQRASVRARRPLLQLKRGG